MDEEAPRLNQHVLESHDQGGLDRLGRGDLFGDYDLREPAVLLGSRSRIDGVLRAVEAEIIPHLVLKQRPSLRTGVVAECPAEQAQVLCLVDLLLDHGNQEAVPAFVAAFLAHGHSVEYVFLDLFQPAARQIGELWDDDLCSFIDVTLALGTLQRMLRDLSPDFQRDARRSDAARQALLVPLPGDQHTLGLSMVAEFFRRSAWSVCSTPFASLDELGDAVRTTWFTVVGFSLSAVDQLDRLASVIDRVRRHSCNGSIGVLVGGPVFIENPDHAARVGADAVGLDARQAVFEAECFATQMSER